MAKFHSAKSRLPQAIAQSVAKKEERRTGVVHPAKSAKAVVDSLVEIRPVRSDPLPVSYRDGPRPVHDPTKSGGRLTAVHAVEKGRDKTRAQAVAAGTKEGVAAYARDMRSVSIARTGNAQRMTRQNPPQPAGDLVSGMLRYTGAFSASPFRAPFQKSWNLRRSYGA